VYVAAVVSEGEATWAIVNLNALDARDRFTRPAIPVSYEDEDADARRARRKRRWTPADRGHVPTSGGPCSLGGP
jgi:hypothetical protein